MKDFFISYNEADLSSAQEIYKWLIEAGYSCIMQYVDFIAGSNFVLEMNNATIECERTIAVLSPDYLSANFTQPEWAAAFAKDPKGVNYK